MRYFPDSELSIFTCGKKYIFELVVVYQPDPVRERSLQHQYALPTLFNISDAHEAFLGTLAIARHS